MNKIIILKNETVIFKTKRGDKQNFLKIQARQQDNKSDH